jgi:predicted nucleic acid-binding protein
MTAKVVDASALAAVLLVEPESDRLARLLSGHELAAPALIDYEIGNVCLKRTRAAPARASFYAQALREFVALDLRRYTVDVESVWHTAYDSGLTFYDASYLWLSRVLGAELVTLDAALRASARRQGKPK